MNDLISRQAAMVVIECSGLDDDSKDTVVRVLEQLPSAQGWTPVKHGCWMTKEYEYGTNGEHDRWVERIAIEGDYAYCSQCCGGVLLDGGEDYVYSAYCPHCGAKMEEVKNE